MIDADHIVSGDGISWMRRFWAKTTAAPIRHPEIVSGFDARTLGMQAAGAPRAAPPPPSFPRWAAPWAATSAPPRPSSAARASYLNFYETGEELFDVM